MIASKQLRQLHLEITKDTFRIPHFIDAKVKHSNIVWREIQNILILIARLTDGDFISEPLLHHIKHEIETCLLIIHQRTQPNTYIHIIDYIQIKLHSYLTLSAQLELYEIAQNLKEFIEIYND